MSGFVLILSLVLELSLLVFLLLILLRYSNLRKERDDLLQEKDVIYGFVHDIGEAFADADEVELEQLLQRVLFYALRTVKAGAGALYLVDESDDQVLHAKAVSGIFPPLAGKAVDGIERAVSKSQHVEQMVMSQPVLKGEGLLGDVADLGTSILIDHPDRDPRVPQYEMDFLKLRGIVIVPMRFRQRVLGVIAVVNRVDGRAFTEADVSMLQALSDQATVSVYYAGLRETLVEKQRLDSDLNLARQIQSSLLPHEIPQIEGVELAAFNVPALEIGGDYYDFVRVDDQHLGVMIADVSGKGITGAIVMSMCRSALRAQAPGCLSPADVLRSMNQALDVDLSEDMFISALYMILNTQTRTLTVARAGHERPILISGDGGGFSIVDSPGIAIGIADVEAFETLVDDMTISLRPGDTVVAYTDGITEAMNEQREEWGVDNFLDALRTSAAEGAQPVLDNVRERALRFVGNMPQYDDMTLLAIRVLG